ncbi:helix-turn-helix transcriptional regulator [Vagococcus sp. BWB3-3]|uniref:Helix-turn-helix transcriptional regulator n=1 Tax=Vagococcus allomyrinae TaxID=2794353 RepID=A0A940SUM4_9ENTE|nr:helix-turn-helix transcriptional regulator [Vagococcus allomyrinae]MBP1040211.1 helix-turn-helix transcriptional regulator [Vagococcus allomyrinae]
MKIGQVIKENRNRKQLTQEALADLINVSRSTISSWENGRSYPDLEMVLSLSEEFDISVDQLLKGDSDIVHELTKDSRLKKKHRLVITGLTMVMLLLLVVMFKFQFKARDISSSDIVSAERTGDEVVITFKKSLFYKEVACNIDNQDSSKTIYISMDRMFAPFSKNTNVFTIEFESLKNSQSKPIKIVNDEFEVIYDVKEN